MKASRLASRFLTGAAAGTPLRALLVLILCGGLNAYGQQITGTITGTVKDTLGAVVTSATIKATNVDTGFSRSTTTTPASPLSWSSTERSHIPARSSSSPPRPPRGTLKGTVAEARSARRQSRAVRTAHSRATAVV